MPYTDPMPRPATTPPVPEANAPAVGTGVQFARPDHVHPRLTSVTPATLGAANEATVMFTQAFDVEPAVLFTYRELTDNPPVTFKVKSFVMDANGKFAGAVIKGYRATIMPALSGILLIGPLVGALSNFNIFGGSAVGLAVIVTAIKQSTPT